MIKLQKHLILVFLFFLSTISLYSINLSVSIDESTTQTKLLSGQYSLNSQGTLTLYNPSNISKVYEYNIPLELDALIGISKVNIDSTSDKFDFSYNRIKGYILNPNQTIRVGYSIYGLLNYDISTKLENKSVFEYYSDFEFSSNTILNLQKLEREGLDYDNNGTLISDTTGGNSSARLISTGIRNPTDFNYFAKEMRIYTTTAGSPMFDNSDLVSTFYNVSIDPFGFEEVDFIDETSVNNSVYWLSSDVIIENTINRSLSLNLVNQKASSSGGGSGGGSVSGNSGGFYAFKKYNDSIILKKSVDKTLVRTGEEFRVIVNIVNVKNFEIDNLTLFDTIPQGYKITNISKEVTLDNGRLKFLLDKISPFSSISLEYTLQNQEENQGITYLQPSELYFKEQEVFSQGVLLINDLLPDKKVFVQKEIDIVDDTYSRVTIKVKNLGSTPLKDLLVTDIISDSAIIKEISQIFYEKGVWRIKDLSPQEEWQVSYLVERNADLENLPNVFGVEKENVYGTLISSEQVITIFQEKPRTIEKVGLVVSVGLLIFYLLF